jgi:hypothetical protein
MVDYPSQGEVSLQDPVEKEEPFSIVDTTQANPAPLPPDVAESRSFKMKYGLDTILNKTKQEIYEGLNKGEEGLLRSEAAAEIDIRKAKAIQEIIPKVVGSKGGPLSVEEALGLSQIISDMNEKTTPETVVEEAYGKQFMATLDTAINNNPNSDVAKLRQQNPEVIAKMQQKHSDAISAREYFKTTAENIEAELKDQGYFGYGFDFAKQAIPGYTDVQLRGNVGVGVLKGGVLGANLEEQRKAIMGLGTFKERKEAFDKVIAGLKTGIAGGNPQLALEFARSMVGMTSDDQFLKSVVLPLDLTGIGLGKAAAKGGRAALEAVGWVKQAEKAATDIARASADPAVSRSTIEAASGDLRESAVTRVTSDRAWQSINGDSRATEQAVEALTESHRTDNASIAAAPGRFGQDIVNRIIEQSETITTSLINAVKNIQKIERLPEIMSNELAVRAILDYTKDSYRGLANSVIHMSKPYKEPIANAYLTDMHIGNVDGTYFKSKEVAQNFADFHGLKSASIEEGTDTAFTKPAVQAQKYTKNIKDAQAIIERETKKLNDASLSDAARAKSGEQVKLAEEYIVDQAASRHALKQEVSVEQQGLGYYVKVTKPIDETSSVVRSFIAETKNTKIPDSPLQRFLNGSVIGKLRTPEETLSLAERQNRLTATYTPSVYFDIMRQNTPTLQEVIGGSRFGKNRNRRAEFKRVLEAGQRMIDPDSTDKMGGYFFKSPQELEEQYLRINNRLPDKDEIAAYFEFKRGMEIDRAFRNIAEHRNQLRVGAETHRIAYVDEKGAKVWSDEFSGVTRQKLSAADDNLLILKSDGTQTMRSLQKMSVAERKEFQKDIDSGGTKLIEIYAPENHPLSGFGQVTESNRVRYVLAEHHEVRDLDWNQVARRGGGHMEYDYDYYIKQAKIKHDNVGSRHWYEGDTTIMPIQVHSMGVKVAGHLNEVRKLLAAKNEVAAQEYSNNNLHIDWDTVKGWFTSGPDANGKFVPARLALNEPIHVLRKGQTVLGLGEGLEQRYANFKNGQKEGSLSRQNLVEFNKERDASDLITVNDVGSRKNPLYTVGQAALVDPITTMNRGLARIAKSNFLDDYKTMSVEHWLKQAQNYLAADNNQIWHAPFYYFNEAKFKPDAPAEIKSALETARFHTQQLTGTPSTTDAVLHSYAQRAYDQLYSTFGPKGLVVDPSWMLPKLKDPFAFVRGVVFNAKLGLFNVPQFIVQAGNYSNIFGIAGSKYATPGTLGAQLHFWSTVNSRPQIIDHLDTMASRLNVPGAAKWRPGEFKEAFEELGKTGFGNTGKEFAVLDNPMSEKIFANGVDKFLDWGQYFFRQGETNARYGAWYTAFKEFRDKVPVGRITEADRASILQRADLLNVNMSRASSSALHQGVWSIPTQFYTYQIRLMELFYGSRLTGVERGRMLATNAAMYGIPMAAGLTGVPAADMLRNYALENGYIVGENFFTTMLAEGLPAAIGAVVSGGGDIQKGTVYDVGNRFGTKGLEFLGGLDRADKGYLDIAGGAAYSVAKSTWEQSDGLRRVMWALVKGDPELFPATYEDGLDVAKEISSVKTINQDWIALQTGRWTSKKESNLKENITPSNVAVNFLLGLKPQEITDVNTLQNALKSQKQSEDAVAKEYGQEFRRGLMEAENNPERAQFYFNRARTILEWADFPEDRIREITNKAMRDNQSLVEKTNMDKFIKRAPKSREDTGRDIMSRKLQMQEKRGEN